MEDYKEALRDVYQDFANFGANRAGAAPMMDGPKFAKFAKDCKLIDKTNLTPTDVDLIFAKAKSKTERRISFDQFLTALSMLADKKFPASAGEDAFSKLASKVLNSQGPKASGATQADSSGIYGKLTDTSLYTGSHKERFNADGTGKGIEGRDRIAKGSGSGKLPAHLEPDCPDEAEEDSAQEAKTETPSKTKATVTVSASSPTKRSPSSASKAAVRGTPATGAGRNPSPVKKGSIFDKLTDASQYTGSHKNRFNSDGSGKGLAGRESVFKGGVSGNDLSQMVKRK